MIMNTFPKNPVFNLLLVFTVMISIGNSYSQPVNHRLIVDVNNTSGTEDGSSQYPYNTIQEAIDSAPDGDTIIVLPGTYYEHVVFNSQNLTLGSMYLITEDPSYIESTIIDGSNNGKVIFVHYGAATISGFTVQNGQVPDFGGSGIHTIDANVIINHCVITGNHDTLADENGTGGLALYGGNVWVTNCKISQNSSLHGIGAIRGLTGKLAIRNTLILENNGARSIDFFINESSITNSTIYGNTGPFWGLSSQVTIISCIEWDNINFYWGHDPAISYSNLASQIPGTGNTSINPLFLNPEEEDFHLRLGSPCIDAGNPDPSYNDPDGSRNDMGYYGGPRGISYTYLDGPPIIEQVTVNPTYLASGEIANIMARIIDQPSSISSVITDIENPDENVIASVTLYDDGLHYDYAANDGYYGNSISYAWTPGAHYQVDVTATDNNSNIASLNNAATIDIIPVPDTVHLPFITEKLTIDGSGADAIWGSIIPVNITKLQTGQVDGPDDFSATFKACWDLDSLYLFIEVTDDSLDNLHGAWYGDRDNIELYLDMKNSRSQMNDPGDVFLRFTWPDGFYPIGLNTGIHYKQQTNAQQNGYQLEAAISLKDAGFPLSGYFGMDIRIVDRDGEEPISARTGWNTVINGNWWDKRTYGVAQLLEFDENMPDQAIRVVDLVGFPSCGTSQAQMLVSLFNFGTEPVNQFDITYSINGTLINPVETANLLILPGDTVVYAFSTLADVSLTGNYSVYVSTLLNGGDPHANFPLQTQRFVFGTDPYEDWTNYSTCNGLTSNFTRSVMEDHLGNIWMGNSYGEISKLNTTTGVWTVYNYENSPLAGNAVALLEDRNGNIWVALDNFGYAVFDGVSWTRYTDVPYVLSVFEDHEGYIWLGGWGSDVTRMDPVSHTFTTFTTSNSGIAGNILWDDAIMEDADNNLWFGTLGGYGDTGGLSKFDGSSWTNYNTGNSGIPSNGILCTAMDNQGNIWLGFGWHGYGISKFDGSTWTNYDLSNSGIISSRIYSIHADGKGNIWCGSDVGLSKFDGTTWENFTTVNSGLTDNYISKITEDAGGNIWIATSNGLCKYTPQMPHFEKVWSGNGMDHMNFYAMSAQDRRCGHAARR